MTPPEGMVKTLKLTVERQSWNLWQEDKICEVSAQDLKGEEKGKQTLKDVHLFDYLLNGHICKEGGDCLIELSQSSAW